LVYVGSSLVLRARGWWGCVQHEFVYDPQTWANKYNLKNGSVFGLSHGLLQLACFRPPSQSGLPDSPCVPYPLPLPV
jgi:phytoene dehydrogenase-like protein